MSKTYKLRAECLHDINELVRLTFTSLITFTVIPVVMDSVAYPDCTFVFESKLSLEEIKEVLKTIPDGHVMLETVQLKENYTGERV